MFMYIKLHVTDVTETKQFWTNNSSIPPQMQQQLQTRFADSDSIKTF